MKRSFTLLATVLFALTLDGCAGHIQDWIANSRVHQGNVAVERGNYREAELEYRLALKVKPDDPHARSGFTQVALQLADAEFLRGSFDDAIAKLNEAAKYDRENLRLQALRTQIEDAKLKREIVISNYPTYQAAGKQILEAYTSLNESNQLIVHRLKRFGFTYDTSELTAAIKQSYDLEQEVAKSTNRLIAYRQAVETGLPASKAESAATPTTTQSLLPLP
ncbi:MAG: tetratricopeptide repeat protein [Candidatus Eremiobacteraeota bacterium]|nr:tetratricopeptide repeat protein [Candidatus Eremiobacteraeota bacterium]